MARDPSKFIFCCTDCGKESSRLSFLPRAGCLACGSEKCTVRYPQATRNTFLRAIKSDRVVGLWRYFDMLPLAYGENIVSGGEGNPPIERWKFLEDFALSQKGIKCEVYAHRHDHSPPTGSFKDLAGSLIASGLKENGVREYVVASTGNIGVACSRYLSATGSQLYAFVPQDAPFYKEAEIACFGQNVFRVKGDYSHTKKVAEEFAKKRKITLASGTFDPFRIEAKKTMAFEWFRLLPDFPTIYIQALSGGTGPLGIYKGCSELESFGLLEKYPRMLMVQSDRCAPMAMAWEEAKAKNFPDGWKKQYSIVENPDTEIPTLATGNPTAYPELAEVIRKTEGDIFCFPEKLTADVAKWAAFECGIRMGPASAIGVGGFFEALKRNLISNGDSIVIAIGEGIRRDPDFMLKLVGTSQNVQNADDCIYKSRGDYRKELLNLFEKYARNEL